MTLREKLRRYFIGNTARIISVEWLGWRKGAPLYTPCNCANSHGFYFWKLKVTWRVPYFEGFAFNPEAQRWEIPCSRRAEGESLQ